MIKSNECTKSELDIFQVPPTQKVISSGSWVHYYPTSSVTSTGPYEFSIAGNSDYYIDFAQSYFKIQAKITKEDGTDLDGDDKVAPINMLLHTMFSEVEMYLGDKRITSSTNNYHYKAYIETLLNYGLDAAGSKLTSEMFYKDTAGQMDNLTNSNTGFAARQKLFVDSKYVDMIGQLHCDIFNQPKLMLNHLNVKIVLIREKDDFCLMASAGKKYKIEIQRPVLIMRKEKPSASVLLAHAKVLQHTTAKYPISRGICKILTIPTGVMSFSHDNVFLGQMPKKLIFGLVPNSSQTGLIHQNPFEFRHYDANHVAISIDGISIPHKPFSPNFKENLFIDCYNSLFHVSGNANNNGGNLISRSEYPGGYTLYCYELSPDGDTCNEHFNVVKNGNLRLDLNFGTALPHTVDVIVYAEFQNIIEVDKNRNIIFDF